MKRIRLALATSLFLAFACQEVLAFDSVNVPDIYIGKIIGTWTHKIAEMRFTITFSKDGTFRGIYQVGEKVADKFAGTWSIESHYMGNTVLKYVYKKSSHIAAGTKDEDTIEQLNDRALWVIPMKDRDQARRIWTRVNEKK